VSLPRPLALADLPSDPLPVAAEGLHPVHQLAPAAIRLEDRLQLGMHAAPFERGGHLTGLLAEEVEVEHRDPLRG
jgi:hypothetical protein